MNIVRPYVIPYIVALLPFGAEPANAACVFIGWEGNVGFLHNLCSHKVNVLYCVDGAPLGDCNKGESFAATGLLPGAKQSISGKPGNWKVAFCNADRHAGCRSEIE